MLDVSRSGGRGGVNGSDESVLTLFQGPTPLQAVQWATAEYDADKRVRGTLLLANAPWGGEDVYLRLYRSGLEDEDAGVRAVSIRAIAMHGSPEDVPLLIEQLQGGNDLIREEAARGLQRLHSPEAITPLLTYVDTRNESNWKVRQHAAIALGQYPERRVLDKLIDSLDERELAVNRAARRSLNILTGQDFGFDGRAWLTWSKGERDHFAGQGLYEYPVFQRDPNFFENIMPWLEVPNEIAASPVGMERVTAGAGDQSQGGTR